MHFAIVDQLYGQYLNIKVVYAKADRQHVIDLDVGEGTTVYQAAEQRSG